MPGKDGQAVEARKGYTQTIDRVEVPPTGMLPTDEDRWMGKFVTEAPKIDAAMKNYLSVLLAEGLTLPRGAPGASVIDTGAPDIRHTFQDMQTVQALGRALAKQVR